MTGLRSSEMASLGINGFFLKKKKNPGLARARLLRGARTQPAGYTTGYKRAALD